MQGPLILDRYRPLETSGTGASGTVEICWDETLQRRVAIKRMPLSDSGSNSPGTIPGLAEARTGALLKHPAIVSVIDFKTEGAEALLIMEAIEGPSLADLITNDACGPMDLDVIAAVAQACADALDFAHENQVLHLDIKPENILIERSGRPKVSDFGISELADAQGFGQACGGTIGYMPPEQICGEDLDQRCDAFAYAMVIYEMLTGENPYLVKDLNRSLALMEECEIDLPSEVRDDVDPDLDEVILTALTPDREGRYETVLELYDELAPFLGNPKAGIKKLKTLLAEEEELAEQEEPDEEDEPEGILGRIGAKPRLIISRIFCALLCWWVAAIGIVGIGSVDTPIALAFAIVAGIIGGFVPGIGALLATGILGVGIIANPAVPLPLGILLIVAAIAWWIIVGRNNTAASSCALLTAPLGLIHLTPLAPLAAGFGCTVGKAAATACMQACLALALAIATGSSSLLHFNLGLLPTDATASTDLLSDTGIWVTLASWILSAVLMSALCSRATRVSSVFGAVLAWFVMLIAQFICVWLATGAWASPNAEWILSTLGALALICLVTAVTAPTRYEEED